MGIFDLFKKKPSAPPPPSDDGAPGWDAIDAAFAKLYPGQNNPIHRAPMIRRMHDLSENAAAFDGISAFDAGTYWHLVGYGLTELYVKETKDRYVSGFGYELTIRVPKNGERPPNTAFNVLEGIGRAVWKGQRFGVGHTIRTGPIDGRDQTPETALMLVRDPAFDGPIDTPHGKVDFLMLVGIRDDVRQQVLAAHDAKNGAPGWEKEIVDALRASNPDLLTPIHRDPT